MKLLAMEIGKRYVVLKGEESETLQTGDHLQREADGSLICREAEGWLDPGEWEDLEVEVEIDRDYYVEEQRKLKKRLEQVEHTLDQG